MQAVRGIEASVESDAERHSGLREHVRAGSDARQVQVDRLLAEDRLARARSSLDDRRMRARRRADHDGAHRLVGKRLAEVAAGMRAMLAGQCFGCAEIEVDYPGEACAWMRG